MRVRHRRMTLFLAAIFTAVVPCAAPGWAQDSRIPSSSTPAAPVDPDIGFLKEVLLNPSNSAEIRKIAAVKLLDKSSPVALAALQDSFKGDASLMSPVLAAMSENRKWPAEMLSTLVKASSSVPKDVWPALAQAIVGYEDAGREALMAAIADHQLAAADRLGPIAVLSSFHQRPAANALVELLNAPNEPREIQVAAMEALERMTGMPYGTNVGAWLRWWDQAKDQPSGDWLQNMVYLLSTQNTRLEAEVESLRQEVAKSGSRLTELYGEFFLSLPASARLDRLPRLLSDDVAVVRLFALGQIDRMLRNGERVPDTLQQKVLERLGDTNAQARIRVARLLDDLGYPEASERIAKAMLTEKDPEVQSAYFGVLANRPSADAVDAVLRGLKEPRIADAAATAAEKLLQAGVIPADLLDSLTDAARAAAAPSRSEAVWRLLVRVGDENDVTRAIQMLDDKDDKLRAGIAAGLRARGMLDPLRARSGDPAIYPALIGALTDAPGTLSLFQEVAQLDPPAVQQEAWQAAIIKVADQLAPADVMKADDMLESIPYSSSKLRIAILEPFGESSSADPNVQVLQQRLVALSLENGEIRRASDLLAGIDPNGADQAWNELRFRIAVANGRFDDASAIKADARSWMDTLNWLVGRDAKAAQAAHAEIGRRFSSELTGKLKDDFESIGAQLAAAAATEARINSSTSGL